jgi:hypothetical protein
MNQQAIVTASVPVLCIDTCSILDIMRDPTRDTARPIDRQAAIDLVAAAESGQLVCLAAEQVLIEFADHDQNIQDEAKRNINKLIEQVERLNKISAVYGVTTTTNMLHLDDHVSRSRSLVGRWLAQLDKIIPGPSTHTRAFARMNACRAPARRGKESSKDCLVYETYHEAIATLRGAGMVKPIVFLSSNTQDYRAGGSKIKPEIDSELTALNVAYAPTMSEAKFRLGI